MPDLLALSEDVLIAIVSHSGVGGIAPSLLFGCCPCKEHVCGRMTGINVCFRQCEGA
jgi:hypothetical protein